MPLFEYRCMKCGYITTFLEKLNENIAEHKCEKCKSIETDKIFSRVSQKINTKNECTTWTCSFWNDPVIKTQRTGQGLEI